MLVLEGRVGTSIRGGHVAEVTRGTAHPPPTRTAQRGEARWPPPVPPPLWQPPSQTRRHASAGRDPARANPRCRCRHATLCQRSAPGATARAPSPARTADAGSMGVDATRLPASTASAARGRPNLACRKRRRGDRRTGPSPSQPNHLVLPCDYPASSNRFRLPTPLSSRVPPHYHVPPCSSVSPCLPPSTSATPRCRNATSTHPPHPT